MSAMLGRTTRLLGAAVILALLVWRLGTGPFLAGIATIDGWSLAAATGIGVLTTGCCAWRWHLVARGLGVDLPVPSAVAAYYRSQFLNTTLPGGVLGDVDRAVHHGRSVGDLSRGLRAVGWERAAGQAVQLLVTITVLLALPSPVRRWVPVAVLAFSVAVLGALALHRRVPAGRPTRWGRIRRTAATDLRAGLLARQAWPGIVLASVLVVAGHTATFLVAARTAGSAAPLGQLLPLALLVLLAMGVPMNLGGWGPREGAAAWAFGLAGLGAAQGLSTSVVYGVLSLVASLPGAALLAVRWRSRRSPQPDGAAPAARPVPASRAPDRDGHTSRTPEQTVEVALHG